MRNKPILIKIELDEMLNVESFHLTIDPKSKESLFSMTEYDRVNIIQEVIDDAISEFWVYIHKKADSTSRIEFFQFETEIGKPTNRFIAKIEKSIPEQAYDSDWWLRQRGF